jgi:Ni,Fe-hydrogenase I cytochrome b subunit
MGNKQFRVVMRWLHIIAGTCIALYVYSPLAEVAAYAFATQFVIIPVVSLSGIVMWKQPALARLWRKGDRATVQSPK